MRRPPRSEEPPALLCGADWLLLMQMLMWTCCCYVYISEAQQETGRHISILSAAAAGTEVGAGPLQSGGTDDIGVSSPHTTIYHNKTAGNTSMGHFYEGSALIDTRSAPVRRRCLTTWSGETSEVRR